MLWELVSTAKTLVLREQGKLGPGTPTPLLLREGLGAPSPNLTRIKGDKAEVLRLTQNFISMKGDETDRYLQHWLNALLVQAPPQNYFGLHGVICLPKSFTSSYLPHVAVNTSRSLLYTRNTLKWHYRLQWHIICLQREAFWQAQTPCWLHLFHLHLSVKTQTFQVSPP